MSQQDLWVVDVRGVKKGPMSTLQVVEALISRQIRVIHRVSRDGGSFKAICNEEYFEVFIQRLIEKLTPLADKETALKTLEGEMSDFDELSGVHKIDVNSLGISEQLEHAKQLQRASADLSMLRKLLIEIRTNRKVVITTSKPEDQGDFLHPDDQDVYIHEGQNFHPFKGGNRYLLVALAFAGLIFFGIDYQERRTIIAEQEKLAQEADAKISNKYLGQIDKDSGGEEKLEESDKNIIGSAKELFALGGKVVGPGAYAQLERYIVQGDGPQQVRVKGKIISRVEASQVFEKLMERAAARILKDQYDEAEDLLLTAIKVPFQPKADALVMLVNVAHKIDQRSNGRMIRTQSVLKMVEKYQKVSKSNMDKLVFAGFLGEFYLDNTIGMRSSFRTFTSIFPEETNGGSLGYRFMVSWESLLAECVNIYNNHSQDPWANAMLTGCLLRTSKKDKADAYARYALANLPSEENVKALAGKAFLLAGHQEEAAEILFEPLKGPKKRFANRLAARKEFCLQSSEHPNCAKRNTASSEDMIKRSIRRSRQKSNH